MVLVATTVVSLTSRLNCATRDASWNVFKYSMSNENGVAKTLRHPETEEARTSTQKPQPGRRTITMIAPLSFHKDDASAVFPGLPKSRRRSSGACPRAWRSVDGKGGSVKSCHPAATAATAIAAPDRRCICRADDRLRSLPTSSLSRCQSIVCWRVL